MTLKTSNSTEPRSRRSGSGTIYPAAPCPESLLDQLPPSEIKVSSPKVSENKECWWMSIKRPRTDYFIAEPHSLVNLLFSVKQSEIWVRDYKSTHPRKFGNHVTVSAKLMHGEPQALATEIWGKICPLSDQKAIV